jgi:NAD(P)-dependent dehydrogenase (short-subunit alcohol dehydrogenase family)
MPLAGSTVVVTGASAGIGRAIALRFARESCRIALLARSAEGLHSAKGEIEAAGGTATAYELDVADAAALACAADAIAREWGGIDFWVNNAMATIYAPVAEITPEEFKRVTEVTYLGTVYGTMAALRHMRSRNSGTIIQVGSALSYRAIPLQSAYCGGKFAIRAFTDSLRSELRHEGSRVKLTMVQLPAVNTPQFDWARNRMGRQAQPIPPIFQPEAIAEHVLRIADDPPRELWIGWPAVKVILGNIAAPGYLDRYLARHAYQEQLAQERRSADQIDNLFEAPPAGHVAHGRFDAEAKGRVRAFRPSHLRAAVVLFALSAVAAAVLAGLLLR